jgi:hypothetical protein
MIVNNSSFVEVMDLQLSQASPKAESSRFLLVLMITRVGGYTRIRLLVDRGLLADERNMLGIYGAHKQLKGPMDILLISTLYTYFF